jgi:hypothetical protein
MHTLYDLRIVSGRGSTAGWTELGQVLTLNSLGSRTQPGGFELARVDVNSMTIKAYA